MERVDARASSAFEGSMPARKLVPDPVGHAALLIRTYGIDRALQIAQTNQTVTSSDAYWSDVFNELERSSAVE